MGLYYKDCQQDNYLLRFSIIGSNSNKSKNTKMKTLTQILT